MKTKDITKDCMMDNKTSIKPEASPSNEDLCNKKTLSAADFVTMIKIETTSRELETYNKTNIKVEDNVNLQNERLSFYKNLASNVKNDTAQSSSDFEMDSKITIKEEPIVSETELPNVEYLDCTSDAKRLKSDTVPSIVFKMESDVNCKAKEFVSDISNNNKSFSVDFVKKESFICSDIDETIKKTDIDCQSETPSVAEMSQTNGSKESDAKTPIDLSTLKSPRFTSIAVYQDSYHTIAYSSGVKTSSEKKIDKETSMGPYICSLNYNPASSIQHFESAENIQVYKCKVCKKQFSSQGSLKRHSLCHSPRKSFKCDTCNKCFAQKSYLKVHTLIHTSTKPFKCQHCEKCFKQKSYLEAHALLHTGTKPFKCKHCAKGFTHKSYLRAHSLLHTDSKSFKCELCNKCFTQKSYLKAHALLHTGIKPFKCEHCAKGFRHESRLKMHTSLHTGSKPFKCDHCDKCFTFKSNLKAHIWVHTGSKPFKCKLCDKCFTRICGLKSHTLLHTGSKPFKCEYCDKCFTLKSSLKSHTLLHTGSKPFKCELCDKCFTLKSSLKKHTLLHTGSKPFKCEHCNKRFTLKSSLNSHTLVHTGSKPFKCEHCDKCFANKSTLRQHITRNVHKVKQ